jgi:hypothetical protein
MRLAIRAEQCRTSRPAPHPDGELLLGTVIAECRGDRQSNRHDDREEL